MKAVSSPRIKRARWITSLAVCGTLLGSAVAAQAEQAIGTVMGVPRQELGAFVAANAVPGADKLGRVFPANNVTVLQVSPEFSSQIVTVAITRRDTGEPAFSVYFPTYGNRDISQAYSLINAYDSWALPLLVGEDQTAVLKVDVLQSATGFYTPGRTRFLMLPGAYLDEIIASNPAGSLRIVHRQKAQVGGGDRDVALVAVEPDGRLASGNASVQVPKAIYPLNVARLIQSLNTNVSAMGTDVSGSGSSTTLEVQ